MTLFGSCKHENYTFPLTVDRKEGPYVTCLDCGAEFEYNWELMKLGAERNAGYREAGKVEMSTL